MGLLRNITFGLDNGFYLQIIHSKGLNVNDSNSSKTIQNTVKWRQQKTAEGSLSTPMKFSFQRAQVRYVKYCH